MNYITNVHTTTSTVHDDGAAYTASGMRLSPAEVHARRIAREAERWLAFASDRTRMRPDTVARKALDATAFAVSKRASSFALPSRLAGTSEHQRALWTMVREHISPWTELKLCDTGDGLAVRCGDDALGEVQPKHLPWVRPLMPFGLRLYLARVTGTDYDGYTLGANVVFGHVGHALDRLLEALGDGALRGPVSHAGGAGDPGATSGDGAATAAVPALSGAAPSDAGSAGGDGAPQLRLVVRPEHEALRGDPDDVVLYRRVDGRACASVQHAMRHSPSGIEWGFNGSGPADLARSILLALTDEATADRLYYAFKAEVISRVPHAGGVIRAGDVRDWVDRHTA